MFNCFQTIKASAAWNPPENATDFPSCHFDIIHVDKTKQSFFCGITASHENDTARSEIVTYFKRVSIEEFLAFNKSQERKCYEEKFDSIPFTGVLRDNKNGIISLWTL